MAGAVLRKACDRCHHLKLGCRREGGNAVCERCFKSGFPCQSSPSQRNRSRRTKTCRRHTEITSGRAYKELRPMRSIPCPESTGAFGNFNTQQWISSANSGDLSNWFCDSVKDPQIFKDAYYDNQVEPENPETTCGLHSLATSQAQDGSHSILHNLELVHSTCSSPPIAPSWCTEWLDVPFEAASALQPSTHCYRYDFFSDNDHMLCKTWNFGDFLCVDDGI